MELRTGNVMYQLVNLDSSFFHNLKYDINFIYKHTSTGKQWKLMLNGQSTKVACAQKITFRDSYALIPMKLGDLANQAKGKDSLYQQELNLNSREGKGIYPCEYISSNS